MDKKMQVNILSICTHTHSYISMKWYSTNNCQLYFSVRQFLAPSSKVFFEKPLSFSLSPLLTLFLLLKYLPLWPPLLFLLNIKESFLQESAFYLANYVAIKRYNKNIKQEPMLLWKSKGENKCTQLAARVIWRERAFEVHQKLIVVKAYRL